MVVVGGGVSGLWAMRKLADRGYSATLVESDSFFAAQSGHSHGYLHRGYIYLDATPAFVTELSESSAEWEERLGSAGCDYESAESILAIGSQGDRWSWEAQLERGERRDMRLLDEMEATSRCREVGLRVPSGGIAVTPEKVVSVTSMARALLPPPPPCAALKGRVTRIESSRQRVISVELNDGESYIEADLFVFVAGLGSLPLVRSLAHAPGWMFDRQSYMLVLFGAELRPCSSVFPGASHLGLFIGARRLPGKEGAAWLISDFVSAPGRDHGPAASRYWLKSAYKRVRSVATILDDGMVTAWGYYPAPKIEFREGYGLHGPAYSDYGMVNAIFALPTKMTLAPLLAAKIVEWAELNGKAGSRPIETAQLVQHDLGVAEETWTHCARYELADLDALLHHASVPPWTKAPR